jgi:hypothetical protein
LDGGAVGLVLGHSVDVDDPLLAVDLWQKEMGTSRVWESVFFGFGYRKRALERKEKTYLDDLALATLVLSTHDQDLVVFADGHGADLKRG